MDQWRILGCHGHGEYGVVHRAVRIGHESEGPVALKRALYPWDPRFMREVGLLALIHHPSIPRIHGHGFWKSPAGTVYPFIVMDWIDGTPLYDWALEHNPSSRQVLRMLAQLARALQATHEACAVHRDVKGENVLVRRSDERAMLTDFGAGHYRAAARLTFQPLPPGTEAYRSPEAGLFFIHSVRKPGEHYVATHADDVFALGITAYRLVTGHYPPSPEPQLDEQGSWHMEQAAVPAPHELNPRVLAQLGALILRMLSLSAKERGTAAELAEELEAAAESAGPEADLPLLDEVRSARKSIVPQWPFSARLPWQGLALAGTVLVLLSWWGVREWASARTPSEPPAPSDASATDLGDTASTTPLACFFPASQSESLAQNQPPQPFPGQLQPDGKGKCPGRDQVALYGNCWVEVRSTDAEACSQNGYVTIQGKCYAPALGPRRKPAPTSNPPDSH